MSISPMIPRPTVEPQALQTYGFAKFAATIDTPGGHILISLVVILMGAGFAALKLPKGEDLIVFALGVLAASMRGNGAENHDTNAPQSARVTVAGAPPRPSPDIAAQNVEKVEITNTKEPAA